jgi:hypothetical protein
MNASLIKCECGLELKAFYATGPATVLACPNTRCTARRTVSGQLKRLWVRDRIHEWCPLDFRTLITTQGKSQSSPFG